MHEIPIVTKISRISNMFTFIKKSNIIVIPKIVSRIHIFFFFLFTHTLYNIKIRINALVHFFSINKFYKSLKSYVVELS